MPRQDPNMAGVNFPPPPRERSVRFLAVALAIGAVATFLLGLTYTGVGGALVQTGALVAYTSLAFAVGRRARRRRHQHHEEPQEHQHP